ncbi:NAD(P)H-binding protein [Microbacterium sp. dk485]|uniref:NAD(P)-dependent oxidoreductase n=1 Tax=Microbacterium sp. dk485 TaxID=2560021 RepID=UPI00142F3EB4|nr:NAD(P)H-binding protein [Microbacterium sp. dk485]
MRHNVSKRRVLVLGATGRTGRHVAARAARAGHAVIALVRREGSFSPERGVREVAWAGASDTAGLSAALEGVDVVISALGGSETGVTTVCTDAMHTLVPTMTAAAVPRLIVVSAHGARESHDRSLYARAVWSRVGEKMADKETMEPLIAASGLEWTIVRPPMLRDSPATGRYRTGEDLPIRLWHFIGRADLADFLVREAEEPQYVRRYPRIRR